MTATVRQARMIDELMERASLALEATDYFEAERLSLQAIDHALRLFDFGRIARICLPLQESRRQRRHLAMDAGRVFIVRDRIPKPAQLEAGCYLIEPPLLGIDARTLRLSGERRKVPMIVVAREPLCKSGPRVGKWPIVGVGTGPKFTTSVRIYVDPPATTPAPDWFLATNELLGDEAILKAVKAPAAWRVEDLIHYLDAHPDHEKLHQALAAAATSAANEPVPMLPFRRSFDDPFSF